MNNIERRIVDMQFDDGDFKKGAKGAIDTLSDLREALDFNGASQGIEQAEAAVNRFSIGNIVDRLRDAVTSFPILGAVGLSVINNLTTAAMAFGSSLISGVIRPLTEGGWKRAMNLEQAQFQLEGLKISWEEIKPAILGAVQGTAYGLDEAAKAASSLAASQVPMANMESSLRAIAGVAAMTSSGYSDIADVFTKVAGQGRVMADDLNRLSARGLNAAAVLAEAFGMTESEVRDLVSEGKVSFEQFASAMDNAFGEHATKANETYTGALSNMNAALARIGAEPAMVKMEHNRRIFNALTPVINMVAKALGPLWGLLGREAMTAAANFEKAMLWITTVFGDKSSGPGDLTRGLGAWANGLHSIVIFISNIGGRIQAAWQKVFPPRAITSNLFTNVGQAFEKLMAMLNKGEGVLNVVGWVAEKFFLGLKFGGEILQAVFEIVGHVFGTLATQAALVRTAVDPLVQQVKEFFSNLGLGGGVDTSIFSNLSEDIRNLMDVALVPVNRILERLTPAIQAFIDAAANGQNKVAAFFGAFDGVFGDLNEFASQEVDASGILTFFSNIGKAFSNGYQMVKPYLDAFMAFMSDFVGGISQSLVDLSSGDLLASINTGVLIAFAVNALVFMKRLNDVFKEGGMLETFLGDIKSSVDAFGGFLGSLDTAIKSFAADKFASAVIKVAGSIAILAAALYLMTLIDADKLGASTAAMVGLMGGLLGMVAIMAQIKGPAGLISMHALAGTMLVVAAAMLVMTFALKKLSEIDEEALVRSVTAMTVVMAAITGMAAVLAIASKTMRPGALVGAAAAMLIMAGSLYVVAGAVAIFGNMPLDVLQQGAVSVGIAIGALVAAGILTSQFAGQMLQGSVGMVAMAAALTLLLIPISALGLLPMDILVQGMAAITILLAAMAGAGVLMGSQGAGMALGAVGMVAMAFALQMLVPSILALGTIDMATLAQGLIGVGIAMGLMAIIAQQMTTAVVGAGAMIAMSIALVILTGAIAGLGALPLEVLAAGLIGVAVALGILIAAGYLATGAAPGLIALSIAAIALGAGMLMLSIGLVLFGPAAVIAAAGILALGKGAQAVQPYLLDLFLLGPILAVFGAGLAAAAIGAGLMGVAMMAMGIGLTLLAASAKAGVAGIMHMVDELTKISLLDMGKMAVVSVSLTVMGVALLALGVGSLAAGVGLLAFMLGWSAFAVAVMLTQGPVTSAIERLAERVPPALTALVVAAEDLASNVPPAFDKVVAAFRELESKIKSSLKGLDRGLLQAGQSMGRSLVQGLLQTMPLIAQAALQYVQALNLGIRSGAPLIMAAAALVAMALLQGLMRSVPSVRPVGLLFANTFAVALLAGRSAVMSNAIAVGQAGISGLVVGMSGGQSRMFALGYQIGIALTNGMRAGINAGAGNVRQAAANMAAQAAQSAKRALQIASPSKVTAQLGKFFSLGLAQGIIDNVGFVNRAADSVANSSIDHLRTAIDEIGDAVFKELNLNPIIKPSLDLSDVTNKSSVLAGILSPTLSGSAGDRVSSIAAGPFREDTTGSSVVNHNEYKVEQTNNSPKALPEAEIYRRTRSALAILREKVES